VFIFSKTESGTIDVRRPDIETYGAPFDDILDECFGVRPPISQRSLDEIEALMKSRDADRIERAMEHLGTSTEKMLLASRLRSLQAE
jgi:hypothetical protein